MHRDEQLSDRILDEAIERLRRIDIPPYPRRIAAPAEAHGMVKYPDVFFDRTRRLIMQRRFQFFAAVVTLAFVVGFLSLEQSTGHKASVAFAETQKALGESQSVMYQSVSYYDERNPHIVRVMAVGQDRVRFESTGNHVQVLDFSNQMIMFVDHSERKVLIEPIYPTPEYVNPITHGLIAKLRKMPVDETKIIGRRRLNSRAVIDFVAKIDDEDYTVTVDVKTKLPVRVEVLSKQLWKGAKPREVRHVISDIVFGPSLDPSLFQIEPPVGYAVERVQRPKTLPSDQEQAALVVSPTFGIGPVKFGMQRDEIIRLVGEPDGEHQEALSVPVASPDDDPPEVATGERRIEMKYQSRGFVLDLNGREGLIHIRCMSQGLSNRGFRGQTKEGLRLGASQQEIVKVYGEPEAKITNHMWYANLGWRFYFNDQKLTGIDITPPDPGFTDRIEIRVEGEGIIQRVKDRK